MGKARAALIGTALAVAFGLAFTSTASAADGRLYAYEDAGFADSHCSWVGDHKDWRYSEWNMPHRGVCSWWYSDANSNFNDEASSIWNNGYPGGADDVRLYKHINHGAPSMCIGNGDRWSDLNTGRQRFSDGSFANDQISSHRWVTSC
jgi:hypothetical protein